MRSTLLLAALLCACTVVPAPTTGTNLNSDHPQIPGRWLGSSRWNTDTLRHRLAIFDDGGYQRWAVDSTQAAGNRTVLLESGYWSLLPQDTTRIVFAPSSRLAWPSNLASLSPAVLTPDTAYWTMHDDSLRLTLRRWWQRDTLETLAFGRD